MRDNHLHTYFSYDSEASLQDYLRHYPEIGRAHV